MRVQADAKEDRPVAVAPPERSPMPRQTQCTRPSSNPANGDRPDSMTDSDTTTISDDSLRLVEAMIFAAAAPVPMRALTAILPDTEEPEAVIAALRERYAGRGVELVEVAGGVQFRTAPDLAPRLTRVIEVPRRLPRVAMETLAIIAYRQPVTRVPVHHGRASGGGADRPRRAKGVAGASDLMGDDARLPRQIRPQGLERPAAP
jgi:hypothetical protein